MKLERMILANFRGFDQIDIQFETDVTVIVGVNGVGKSASLSAIVKTMSLALPRITPSKEKVIGLADTDVKADKDSLSLSVVLNCSKAKIHVDIARSTGINAAQAKAFTKRRDELRFATRETKKGSKEEQDVEDEIRRIEMKLSPVEDVPTVRILPLDPETSQEEIVTQLRGERSQPICVYYSTSRFLSRLPPSLPKTKAINIATAYNKALEQLEVSLNDFANWYRVLAEGKQAQRAARMFQQLETAIAIFLPGMSGLSLQQERPPRFSVNKNGSKLYLEQLSDGERGLLALVFDLTRRLAIANPQSDNPIAEGVALVLIDEIELHLHPKWQRDVTKRLLTIFKNCQFVITTHSPQVIGEVQARCVRLLSDHEGKVVSDTPGMAFGTDSNWILNVLMGADEMNEDVEKELENVSILISDRQLDEAKHKIHDLRNRVGNTKRIQLLVSTIERIQRLGK